MKRLSGFLAFLGLVIAVAAISAGLCIFITSHLDSTQRARTHERIHQELDLSADQKRALEPIERKYAAERRRLETNLHLANVALADVIEKDKENSEDVHRAIDEIHARMGELQMVTIGHIFEMRNVLTPEQYDKLLRLTAAALRKRDENSHDEQDE